MATLSFKVCTEDGRCRTEEFEVRAVKWIRISGKLFVLGRPPERLVGGDAWGYAVWGGEAINVLIGNGTYPVVALNEEPSDVVVREGWKSIAFGGKAPEPWAPISVTVRGVNVPARKGVLVATP
ncbi:hypothetical protein [Ignicoccus hospitalis]|uniref:Uncharacterized protein n=1 Tax=Ignicoccus hospitalis (strain KIN4/I / DSM 18386 / JCM 14125) TaxID=453591 RepID=A8AAD0_IGNH4|nr:hypothetical protein [Ignicoccus hospitalis]ABU81882.1 hypothetical protein Igni_0700 [Ignicoccus hospitalis KIN4/I]HIH89960.1 hypothetical protein [Desulfurococcaceae archaeon]